MNLTPQHTRDLQAPPPKPPKRKPSARSPWKPEEIPTVLDCLQGRYRVRNQAMLAMNLGWGLRVSEDNSLTVGDITHADGSLKDVFVVAPERLKGGKPRPPWRPKPYPADHVHGCMCSKCGGQKPPKQTPPIARTLPITPEMRPYLLAWLKELWARVGELTPDMPLWLSRKRTQAGAWKAISRQQHWHIIVEACKVAETKLEGFSHQDFGSHSARKTVVTVLTDSTGDILIASRYIGHKGIGVTQAYYKANPRRERENVGKMVALILPAVAA
jgi:integrase